MIGERIVRATVSHSNRNIPPKIAEPGIKNSISDAFPDDVGNDESDKGDHSEKRHSYGSDQRGDDHPGHPGMLRIDTHTLCIIVA